MVHSRLNSKSEYYFCLIHTVRLNSNCLIIIETCTNAIQSIFHLFLRHSSQIEYKKTPLLLSNLEQKKTITYLKNWSKSCTKIWVRLFVNCMFEQDPKRVKYTNSILSKWNIIENYHFQTNNSTKSSKLLNKKHLDTFASFLFSLDI